MQIDSRMYAQAWYEALKASDKKEWPTISQNLLRRLQTEGKLSWVPNIERQVIEFTLEEAGITQASVKTAHPLSEKKISSLLSEFLGDAKLELSISQDPELIGGLIIETQDSRWDLSIKSSLSQLKRKLTS